MSKKEIYELIRLLKKSFNDYGDQVSYSAYFEPEKIDLGEWIDVLEEELTKEKKD